MPQFFSLICSQLSVLNSYFFMMRTRLLLYFIESMNFFLLLLRFFIHTRYYPRKGRELYNKKTHEDRRSFFNCKFFFVLCLHSPLSSVVVYFSTSSLSCAALHKKRRELDLHYHLMSTVSLLFRLDVWFFTVHVVVLSCSYFTASHSICISPHQMQLWRLFL